LTAIMGLINAQHNGEVKRAHCRAETEDRSFAPVRNVSWSLF